MKDKDAGFLGTGWHFPPTFDKYSKTLAMVSAEQDIVESLGILLSTSQGERVMLAEYGAEMDRLIFEPLNTELRTYMESSLKDSITLHEPRVKLEKITLTGVPEEGRVDIAVDYTIVITNTRYNNVFPYYLNEANIL
jgi:uncharacterized protein